MATFSELSNPECDRCGKPIFGIYTNHECSDPYTCTYEVYCSDCVHKAMNQNKKSIRPGTRFI